MRLDEIIGIWREKIICPKHDEILGVIVPSEVADVIRSTLLIYYLLKILILSLSSMKSSTFSI